MILKPLYSLLKKLCSLEDNILSEARNLRNMSMAQTPLFGEENTLMHSHPTGGGSYESATPHHQVAFTPNPLATPSCPGSEDVSTIPRCASVTGTPLHTLQEQRLHANSAKCALQARFMNLPKPENNFELLVPEDKEEGTDDMPENSLSEEDAEERDAKLRRAREEEEKRTLAQDNDTDFNGGLYAARKPNDGSSVSGGGLDSRHSPSGTSASRSDYSSSRPSPLVGDFTALPPFSSSSFDPTLPSSLSSSSRRRKNLKKSSSTSSSSKPNPHRVNADLQPLPPHQIALLLAQGVA
jgi:hypothetical protein